MENEGMRSAFGDLAVCGTWGQWCIASYGLLGQNQDQHSKKYSWPKWGNIFKMSQMWGPRAWELERVLVKTEGRQI